jgi:hypothetical protein
VSLNSISGIEHARNQEYVHRVNVAKGWFDKPVTFLDAMALLMTEVVEAWLAFTTTDADQGFAQFSSELADCYIRWVDDCSRFGVDLSVAVDLYQHTYEPFASLSFDGEIMNLVRRIRDIVEAFRVEGMKGTGVGRETTRALVHFFLQLQGTCDTFGVSLPKAFDLKMAVNEARPYRHGGKHA